MISYIRKHLKEWAKDPTQPLFSARTKWWMLLVLLLIYIVLSVFYGDGGV